MDNDRVLWRIGSSAGELECRMISCCSGAELQLLKNGDVVLRELYPDKSTLYERARDLQKDYEAAGPVRVRF
jgi:hypothetical protein